KHPFAWAARRALAQIALREAELALDAELAALDPATRAEVVAAAAWASDEPGGPRATVARERLPALGAIGVAASRARVARTHRMRGLMVDYFASQYAVAPEAATGALLELAAGDSAAESAFARLADLRPPGVAAAIVALLERPHACSSGAGIRALAQIGDPIAIPFLTRALESEHSLPSDTARALFAFGEPGRAAVRAVARRGGYVATL